MEVILIMKCTFCGAELNDDAMFCTECGRAIEAAPAEPAEAFVKAEKDPGKILGIIALILGIVAIALPIIALPTFCCCSIYVILIAEVISFVCAVVGIILGVLGSKKSAAAGYKNMLAKIGMILSIVSAALVALALVLVVIFLVIYILIVVLAAGGSAVL